MKAIFKFLGFVLLAVLAIFLYRRFVARKDPLQEHLAEQDALVKIGYQKTAVMMDAMIPSSQIGDTPLAGLVVNPIYDGPQAQPKPLQLFPKGPFKVQVDPEVHLLDNTIGTDYPFDTVQV